MGAVFDHKNVARGNNFLQNWHTFTEFHESDYAKRFKIIMLWPLFCQQLKLKTNCGQKTQLPQLICKVKSIKLSIVQNQLCLHRTETGHLVQPNRMSDAINDERMRTFERIFFSTTYNLKVENVCSHSTGVLVAATLSNEFWPSLFID